MLVELLRAEQQRLHNHRNLVDVRNLAAQLLDSLVKADLITSVEERVRQHLQALSVGVSHQHAFVGGQYVDDAYLARVLELLLSTIDDRGFARRLELSGLGYANLLHIAVTLAAIPDPSGTGGPSGIGDNPNLPDVNQNMQDGYGTGVDSQHATSTVASRSADAILDQTDAEAEADQDAFFPVEFHVSIVIEEPEASSTASVRASPLPPPCRQRTTRATGHPE